MTQHRRDPHGPDHHDTDVATAPGRGMLLVAAWPPTLDAPVITGVEPAAAFVGVAAAGFSPAHGPGPGHDHDVRITGALVAGGGEGAHDLRRPADPTTTGVGSGAAERPPQHPIRQRDPRR